MIASVPVVFVELGLEHVSVITRHEIIFLFLSILLRALALFGDMYLLKLYQFFSVVLASSVGFAFLSSQIEMDCDTFFCLGSRICLQKQQWASFTNIFISYVLKFVRKK